MSYIRATSSRGLEQRPESSTSRSKPEYALEELRWRGIFAGRDDPREFEKLMKAGLGWKTSPSDSYPLDIVISLKKLSNVYKVVVEVDDVLIPSWVEVKVGRGTSDVAVGDVDEAKVSMNLASAERATYGKKGRMEFTLRGKNDSKVEARALFTDHVGQYVWLVVGKAIETSGNPGRLVGIRQIIVLGYPISEEDLARYQAMEERERAKRKERAERNRLNYRREDYYASETVPEKEDYEDDWKPKQKTDPYRYSSEGGSYESAGGNLTEDPLMSLRTVKQALVDKMQISSNEGRDVEATMCRRAIQRLEEFETRIVDLAGRRANALKSNNPEQAERILQAMVDCRDTAFRGSHVDLLLNRRELRSIGVNGTWTRTDEE